MNNEDKNKDTMKYDTSGIVDQLPVITEQDIHELVRDSIPKSLKQLNMTLEGLEGLGEIKVKRKGLPRPKSSWGAKVEETIIDLSAQLVEFEGILFNVAESMRQVREAILNGSRSKSSHWGGMPPSERS